MLFYCSGLATFCLHSPRLLTIVVKVHKKNMLLFGASQHTAALQIYSETFDIGTLSR